MSSAAGFWAGRARKIAHTLTQHSPNWIRLAQACAFNAVPICTAYDSLGPDGLAHSLNETEVRAMFTNAELLGTLSTILHKCPTVRTIVYDGKPHDHLLDKVRSVREGIQLVHVDEVRKLGIEKPVEAIPANRDDVYCCMYTSGSSECDERARVRLEESPLTPFQPVPPRVCFSPTATLPLLVSQTSCRAPGCTLLTGTSRLCLDHPLRVPLAR